MAPVIQVSSNETEELVQNLSVYSMIPHTHGTSDATVTHEGDEGELKRQTP